MRRALGLSALLVLLTASLALAQTVSSTTGAIDGKVTAILVAEGDNVKTDETVIQLE